MQDKRTDTVELPKKAAIYVRVSTHFQIDKDSLRVQKRDLIAYAEMVLGVKEYTIFEDPGYSAKNTDRPEYQNMISRLRTGEFSHLLVWKIDRISRNLQDFTEMYEELKELGVAFVSKNEQFDTSTAIGEAMLKIILVFAELERKMTSERVTAVMISRANNGQWNGGKSPFGYGWDKEKKEFFINENEAKIVRKIYDQYEDSQSLIAVSTKMNENGYVTRKGNQFSPTVIHKCLSNPFYIGTYRYNMHMPGEPNKQRDESEWIVIRNHHLPIIEEAQFDRVQFILQRNWRGGFKRGESHQRKNVHIFAGLIRCGLCGNNMSCTLDKRRANGIRPSMFGCSNRRGNRDACKNKYVNELAIGPFVFNYVANIIKAHKSITRSTSVAMLEQKLLHGKVFSQVEHIGNEELSQLRQLLLTGYSGLEYFPNSVKNASDSTETEYNRLIERKQKAELAMNRLKSLYLFGDQSMPEKDFIIQRTSLMQEIEDCDKQLAALRVQDPTNSLSTSFIDKASYYIMIDKITGRKAIDYERDILSLDPLLPRNFIMRIIDEIEVTDGKVTSIKFKNGILHTFTYKSENA